MTRRADPRHAKMIGGHDAQGMKTVPLLTERAKAADSFVDSVGVVTHLSYDNTPYYTEWKRVFAILKSSGMRHIRDGYYDWDSSSAFVKEHRELAEAGIHTTYVMPRDGKTTARNILRFSEEVQDLEAVEGPNECDSGQNCGGGGKLGIRNAASFQETVHAAGELLHVPVLGPSFTSQEAYASVGDLSRLMSVNNLHVYYGGRNPGSSGWGSGDPQGHNYGSLDWWLDQSKLDGGSLPISITETGYMMPAQPTPYKVPRSLGASYLLRTLLLAFNHGAVRTFVYELLDEVSSPDYGLLTADLSEKPAFTAISSLLHILSDQGPSFPTGTLSYGLQGGDADMAHTLLQKRDGSFWLIVWKEASEYDPSINKPLTTAAEKVILNLPPKFMATQVLVTDEMGAIKTIEPAHSRSACNLYIDGHITIIKIVQRVAEQTNN